jgi:predicted acyl esterase
MRDGVELAADVWHPDGAPGRCAVLTRTPHDKNNGRIARFDKLFSSYGYAVVATDVRGRGDSDGTFRPDVNDAEDGVEHHRLAGGAGVVHGEGDHRMGPTAG